MDATPVLRSSTACPPHEACFGGRAEGGRNTIQALDSSQLLVNVCEEFLRLTQEHHMTVTGAAKALGKSPSLFSGPNSVLSHYQRGGLAALAPPRRDGLANASDLTRYIESLTWFIPAARFFYLSTNLSTDRGSVPEAIRRTISLPLLPIGWRNDTRARFLKSLPPLDVGCRMLDVGCSSPIPTCPKFLRETLLARERAGQPLVPPRIARQIIVNPALIAHHRSPKRSTLDTLSAPGSQRRYFDAEAGQRQIMQPGDWFGGDDATPGIAVCVPCNEVLTPCSQKYGVLLGRFQWLAYHDCRTDKLLAWDYVVRPRGSYRAEDVVNGMGMVTRAWGIPRIGWQLEGGTFNALLVRHAIKMLGCEHWRTYSPHQKAIESIFNRVWTNLAVQFPHADMGRYRAENEANCRRYEACKRGHQDPTKHFPSVQLVLSAFESEVAAHNSKPITSVQYGQWIPDDAFGQAVLQAPLRPFAPEMDYIFHPFACVRKIRGMIVRCRIPMFEDFSVPFEFHAPWMVLHNGRQVRIHFNPRDPKAVAKVIAVEDWPGLPAEALAKAGDILGDAHLIGETAGHIRLIMGWADDDQRAGYIARQRTANFLRRETRAVSGAGGGRASPRAPYSSSEERDGLGTVTKIESSVPSASAPIPPILPIPPIPQDDDLPSRLARADAWEKQHALDFI